MIVIEMQPPSPYDYDLYLLGPDGKEVMSSKKGVIFGKSEPEYIEYSTTTKARFYVKIAPVGDFYSPDYPYEFYVSYPGGYICGKITKLDGITPISNASIKAYFQSSGELAGTTSSDENGNYTLALKEDIYDLKVSAVGYISKSSYNVVVELGKFTEVNFQLMEYTPDNVIDNTSLSESKFVAFVKTNSKIDIEKILNDPEFDAHAELNFAVWDTTSTNYFITLATSTSGQQPPPNFTLRFLVEEGGDIYVGVIGSVNEVLSSFTFGWGDPLGPYGNNLNEKQNLLFHSIFKEWKKIKYKSYAIGGPESRSEFFNLACVKISNRLDQPVFIVFSAIAHAQEINTTYSKFVHPRWSPATTPEGTKNLKRKFEISYLSQTTSYITLTCFSDDGNSSEIIIGTISFVTQQNYGQSVIRISTFPTNIEIVCQSNSKKVYASFWGAFLCEELSPSNWHEEEDGIIDPLNSYDQNPKPAVYKLSPGWNYESAFGDISGKVTLGNLVPIANAKVLLTKDGAFKSRTITDENGYYVLSSTENVYDVIASSIPTHAEKKIEDVSIIADASTPNDIILNELIPPTTVERLLFLDSGGEITKYESEGISPTAEPERVSFNGDGYYHSILVTTFTFDRGRGDIVFEVSFMSQDFGRCGFGIGDFEGSGNKCYGKIYYGIILDKSTRSYIISGEDVFSEDSPVAGSTVTYKITFRYRGGGGISVDGTKIEYGVENLINNLPFVVWSSTSSSHYLTGLKITQFEIVELSTGIVYGRVTRSDGKVPISGATVEADSISSTSTDQDGEYSLTLSTGIYDVKASHPDYLEETKPGVEVLPRQKTLVNFSLNESQQKPDLIIKSLIPTTTAPIIGETVGITIVIKNNDLGNASGKFYVDFYKNLPEPPKLSQAGDVYWEIDSLLAEEEKELNTSFVYEGGLLNMYAQIDTGNSITESDENNNIFGPVRIGESIETAIITGVVYCMEDNIGIENAQVCAIRDSTITAKVYTNADGSYRLNIEAGKSYSLTASAENFLSSTTVIPPLSTGATFYQDFYLKLAANSGIIGGYVLKDSDRFTPIHTAEAYLLKNSTIKIEEDINPIGFFRIIVSSPIGSYELRVSAYGYNTYVEALPTIEVSTAVIKNIYLQLSSPTPSNVRGLLAIPKDNLAIELRWKQPVSGNISRYRIYYLKGKLNYHLLYSSYDFEINSTYNSYTIPSLDRGSFYYFSVRAVDSNGVENVDTNNIVRAMPIDLQYGAKTYIETPQSNQKFTAGSPKHYLTIIAEQLWDTYLPSEVKFEYKLPYLPEEYWEPLQTPDENPSRSYPHFVHWKLKDLPYRDYELRAVADGDPSPPSLIVSMNPVDYEIEEKISGDEYLKTQMIYHIVENSVKTAGIGEKNITELIIYKNTLPESTTITLVILPKEISTGVADYQPHKVRRIISDVLPQKDFRLFIPYDDFDDDGIIDGTVIKSDYIKPYYFENGRWLPQRNYYIDKKNHRIGITTSRLTRFAIFFPVPSTNLKNVIVFPNPFKPWKGHRTIKFKRLTKNTNLKIFNIAGELVFETNASAFYEWDVRNNWGEPVASGVYIFLVTDSEGHRGSGKFAIIK